MFFFEKKNQKTFVDYCGIILRGPLIMSNVSKSFLVLFFKKGLLAFP